MLKRLQIQSASAAVAAGLAVLLLLGFGAPKLRAVPRRRKKAKHSAVSANDPTARLFDLLNNSFEGKLSGLYVLAGIYSSSSNPAQQFQRVLRVTYDKDLYFGKFSIHARSVVKMTPQQLAIYSPEQIFNFGGQDGEVFEKINPGPFGSETGDLFLSAAGGPLRTAPITDEITQEYNALVSQYILPAVQKQ
ncbi:MAG: hypothetical protein ACRD3O_10575, partial [Terriglobia bacterium]